jgi:hypothetical protein
MVEYVLGGSPTNKESPLAVLDSRFAKIKFEEVRIVLDHLYGQFSSNFPLILGQ